MKMSYRQRLTLYFCLLFALFTAGIIILEQSRERRYKTEALEGKLDAYADIAMEYIRSHPAGQPVSFDELMAVLPDHIRFTWIDGGGNVMYDNVIGDPASLENHAGRPEIRAAAVSGKGSDIRVSVSNDHEYLYYAKQSGNSFIRMALPYNIQVRDFLKPDNASLYYILLMFVVVLVVINLVAGRFGKSIRRLRDFSVAAGSDQAALSPLSFPNDELGEIGANIVRDYEQLRESKDKIALEREKLLQHVHSSSEGICFFTAGREVAYYNGLFIQFLNVLVDQVTVEPGVLLTDDLFADIHRFLSEKGKRPYFETMIQRQGKHFAVRVNRFDDHSFEVILNDQTRQEKTRQLKQEMTGNISHELRTPVASIRGYLETILDKPMDAEKERHFLQKAYNQVITLSELIQDMSLLTKIDETPEAFRSEPVALNSIVQKIHTNMGQAMQAKGITIRNDVPADTAILGNENLLYAVFRNLTENVVRYAGENIQITIRQYNREGRFAYFSFADNGVGIKEEKHLRRLFERFYRINEGRSRETGGTGLGLSIVKNVITFHGGSITVKNRAEGGLEFLFSLPVLHSGLLGT